MRFADCAEPGAGVTKLQVQVFKGSWYSRLWTIGKSSASVAPIKPVFGSYQLPFLTTSGFQRYIIPIQNKIK
jgi:hypothetical protein